MSSFPLFSTSISTSISSRGYQKLSSSPNPLVTVMSLILTLKSLPGLPVVVQAVISEGMSVVEVVVTAVPSIKMLSSLNVPVEPEAAVGTAILNSVLALLSIVVMLEKLNVCIGFVVKADTVEVALPKLVNVVPSALY